MADQVSVRIAVTGGAQFKQEMASAGAAGQRAMAQVEGAGRNIGPAFQNAAFQVQDFIVQVAGGTSATRAFAQQAPQFLSAFGPVGVVLGVVAAAAGALAPAFFAAAQGGRDAADAMGALDSQASAVEQQMNALRAVQDAYVDAINAQGPASAAASAAVIANSRAEFAARRQLLQIELDLLRLRGSDARGALEAQQAQVRAIGDAVFRPGYRDTRGDPQLGSDSIYAPDPNRAAREREFDEFFKGAEEPGLRARREALIIEMRERELQRGQEALNTEFATIGTTAGTGGRRRGGGGGSGGGAAGRMAEEAKRIFDATRTSAERYSAELEKINAAYQGGQIDQDTYARALDQLKAEFDETRAFMGQVGAAVKSAFGELFDSIVQGGEKAGDVLGKLAQRLASMALQRTAFDFLGAALPSIFGAGGFLPLLNANGNAFSNGMVEAFAAGGVVSSPHLFNMRGGRHGVMGEAGPEGILPLTRIGGKLGVSAAGTGGGTVVQVINNSGQPVPVERSTGPDLREIVRIIVGEEIGGGRLDRPMARFGARPVVGGKSRA